MLTQAAKVKTTVWFTPITVPQTNQLLQSNQEVINNSTNSIRNSSAPTGHPHHVVAAIRSQKTHHWWMARRPKQHCQSIFYLRSFLLLITPLCAPFIGFKRTFSMCFFFFSLLLIQLCCIISFSRRRKKKYINNDKKFDKLMMRWGRTSAPHRPKREWLF